MEDDLPHTDLEPLFWGWFVLREEAKFVRPRGQVLQSAYFFFFLQRARYWSCVIVRGKLVWGRMGEYGVGEGVSMLIPLVSDNMLV